MSFSPSPGAGRSFPRFLSSRAKILAGLALVLLFWGFVGFRLIYSPEPSYEGKTLRQWIQEGAVYADSSELMSLVRTDPAAADQALARVPAFGAMWALGAEAVPALMECLRIRPIPMSPPVWRRLYVEHIANSKYLSRLFPPSRFLVRNPTPATRFAALCLVGMNRLSAAKQVSLLVKLRHDSADYSVVCYLLKRTLLSPEPWEPILDRFFKESGDYPLAIELYNRYGVREVYLVKYFIPLLTNHQAGWRQTAACTLMNIGFISKPALPALMKAATSDPDALVRTFAVEAIGAIGPGAKEAIPLLVNLAKAEDGRLGAAAAQAIKQIDPRAANEPAVSP